MSITVACLCSVYAGSIASEVCASIRSILSGGSLPDQLIIFVDGPISISLSNLLDTYTADPLVTIVYSSINLGLGRALAAGLEYCTSDIVCRFDTDDISLSDRLAVVRQAFEGDPTLDIMFSSLVEFSPISSVSSVCRHKRVPECDLDIRRHLLYRNVVNHPAVAFKKASVVSVGSYRHFRFFEDYYLWLRCRKAGLAFRGINQPLVFMRRDSVLGRRSGHAYFLSEIRFAFISSREGLLPLWVFPIFCIRAFSRLLPGFIQRFQDHLPWRGEPFRCVNPDSIDVYDRSFMLANLL